MALPQSCSVTVFLFWRPLDAIVSPWSGTILAVQEPYLSQGNRSAVVRTFFGQARCSKIWQHDGGMEIAEHLNVLKELRSTNRNLDASDLC